MAVCLDKGAKITYPAESNVTLVIGGILGRLLDRLFGKRDYKSTKHLY